MPSPLRIAMPPFSTRRAAHIALGRRGERCARTLLRERGLDILVTNYRGPRGEIDIVARDDTVLCFVEVKTRHRIVRSRPADAVGTAKKHSLSRTAHQYLREIGWPNVPYRYDIVEVVLEGRRLREIRHLPRAFTEEDVRRTRRRLAMQPPAAGTARE